MSFFKNKSYSPSFMVIDHEKMLTVSDIWKEIVFTVQSQYCTFSDLCCMRYFDKVLIKLMLC